MGDYVKARLRDLDYAVQVICFDLQTPVDISDWLAERRRQRVVLSLIEQVAIWQRARFIAEKQKIETELSHADRWDCLCARCRRETRRKQDLARRQQEWAQHVQYLPPFHSSGDS